jgi:hypothetical protein
LHKSKTVHECWIDSGIRFVSDDDGTQVGKNLTCTSVVGDHDHVIATSQCGTDRVASKSQGKVRAARIRESSFIQMET